nr:hypothetical protein CFP56_60754 [Quercus suber]
MLFCLVSSHLISYPGLLPLASGSSSSSFCHPIALRPSTRITRLPTYQDIINQPSGLNLVDDCTTRVTSTTNNESPAMSVAISQRSVVTPPTVTPPSLNRQQSYSSSRNSTVGSASIASTFLANLRTRSMSPASSQHRSNTSSKSATLSSSADAPPEVRRTSWEECKQHRDPSRYISFPDFDELRHHQEYANRQ